MEWEDARVSEPADDRIAYEEFGARFFRHAVTAERIVAGLRGLAGERIEFGPIGAGPGKMAKVSAEGEFGTPAAERVGGELVAFRLSIPVELDLLIDLGVDRHKFHAAIEVGLDLAARAADPLRIVIDVKPPTASDVTVNVEASGLRASVLQRVAGVDEEIRRFVARYVARELDKPHIVAARDIDVAARIDGAWRAS